MYLIDTNVISEARKGDRANPGVRRFFDDLAREGAPIYLSAITIGEIHRGVEIVCQRGDHDQADQLDSWLTHILAEYADAILPVDTDIARLWGHLRTPHPEHALDKFIAATALLYDLTAVTRNEQDFAATGARIFNPFT
jgi:predicted nucleic acid-binding protein